MENAASRRSPIIAIGALVALDLLLLGMLFCRFDWKLALAETLVTSIAGLLVIGYYEWRWADVVVKSLESEPGVLDRLSLERILLLIAGIVLLIPGVLTDAAALILLVPWVRRLVARRYCLRCHDGISEPT
jgi:UPF0716 protein FxsA